MSEFDTDVLIIGAGPAGLALAIALARYGVKFRIIDKNAERSAKSKALAVHSRTLEVFEDLELIDRFLQESIRIEGVNIFAEKTQIARLTFDGLDSPYPFTVSLSQSKTEQLLEEKLSEFGLFVERSSELLTISNESECVVSRIKQEGGKEALVRSRWAVGCDGAHSAVRHALNLSFSGSQ